MKQFFFLVAGLIAVLPANADVNVRQQNNNATRDGLYIDSNFTLANAANLTRDTGFNGTIVGNSYAQPLYIEGGPGGRAKVIAVTESNNVYALDAVTGTVIWSRTDLGTAVTSGLQCPGNISPLGISGTPIVDLASRALFFDALINTTPRKHFVYSLNVDTGVTNSGWPVDVNLRAVFGSTTFRSIEQNQRGGLALLNNILYVPYSGLFGDCGNYHGWVVGIPINNPGTVTSWATAAVGGGIWGHSGVACDGTNLFVATGNTFSTGGTWQGGEAMVRLQGGPAFTGNTTDYWAPTNWLSLDNTDTDLGGCSAMLIDVPGAMPSQLVLALGKDRNAYLINRNNLGGIVAPVSSIVASSSVIRGSSAATYRTSMGTYFAFRGGSATIYAYRINAANPPTMTLAWSVSQSGFGSPFVTTTDGTNNAIVWAIGSEGDQRLHGYNGDTGAVVFNGGAANELMTATRRWSPGIVARGRMYLPADNKIYSFRVPPIFPFVFSNVSRPPGGPFQFSFPNVLGTAFSVYGSTSLAVPVASWPLLGSATEISPGQYQFTDPAPAKTQKFYRVTSP